MGFCKSWPRPGGLIFDGGVPDLYQGTPVTPPGEASTFFLARLLVKASHSKYVIVAAGGPAGLRSGKRDCPRLARTLVDQ